MKWANALQRTRRERRGCNPCVPCAGSLLGRSGHSDTAMNSQMSPRQIELLLEELCVVLGFCLPPDANVRLMHEPPTDVDAFTDAVI